jgi:regulator of protease activity HflC (stomatin/prohibitin superfamily)
MFSNDDMQKKLNELLKNKKQQKEVHYGYDSYGYSDNNNNNNNGGNKMQVELNVDKKKIGRLVGGVVGGIFAIVLIAQSSTIVQPGYQGVQFSLAGGLKDKVLTQGLKWHAPWVEVTQYPVSTETVYLTKKDTKDSPGNESMDVNTSDGKSVNIDVVYSYHMESKKLPHIFTKFRRAESDVIEDGYMKTRLKTAIQEVTTDHSVLGVYTEQRSEVTAKITEELEKVLGKDGIILENFAMSDVRPDKKTLVSLQKIADAQNHQEFLKREEVNKTQEAINNKVEAEGKAAVAVVEAEAKAKKIQIEADAQSAANAKLQQSLTNEIIQSNWIDKWDGAQPLVGGGSNSLIQLPSDLLKK